MSAAEGSGGPEIRQPADLDAAWFTRALNAAGIDARVNSVAATPVGTGQVGDSIRFRLSYTGAPQGAPKTLVGKFPAADPKSFASALNGGNYVREVRFYQRLAATAEISTPKCYFADVDEHSGRYVLLLEDLAPAAQGDQLAGVSIDQARLTVEEAAKLHASHWGEAWLEDEPWIVGSRAAPRSPLSAQVFQDFWRGFSDRYGANLEQRTLKAGAVLAERIERFAEQGAKRCLIHGDFRPDNIMFATSEGGRPITVLDWQSIGLGSGAVDVGYFLAGALQPEARRSEEANLISYYQDVLRRGGVIGYEVESLRRDYAAGGLRLLYIAIAAAMRMKQTARGDQMFKQMAEAAAQHAYDNDALDLLY
jgi:hypothetical protein